MAGQDFTMERRDSWPKTEAALDFISSAIGYVIMMAQIVVVEIPRGGHKKPSHQQAHIKT